MSLAASPQRTIRLVSPEGWSYKIDNAVVDGAGILPVIFPVFRSGLGCRLPAALDDEAHTGATFE